MLFDIDCWGPCPIKPIPVLIAYQKIEDLDAILTLTNAIADRINAEIKE